MHVWGLRAAAGVRQRDQHVCGASSWSECGYTSQGVITSRDEARQVSEQVTWPGRRGGVCVSWSEAPGQEGLDQKVPSRSQRRNGVRGSNE